MRSYRRALSLGAAAAAIVAAVAVVITPAAADVNVLANPGFETGNLSGWSCASTDSVVTGHAHGGTFALQGAASNSDFAQCTQTVAVAPNTRYTLSAFVNGSYVFIGATGTGGTDPSTFTPGSGGAYTQLSVSFTTGAGTTSVSVFVHGWYAQGTYFADDISLFGPGVAPSPTTIRPTTASPTPTRTASPTPTRTSSPTPTPTRTTPPGPLPKHFLTGYWHDFAN